MAGNDELRQEVRRNLPEIDNIENDELRDKVVEAWVYALSQSEFTARIRPQETQRALFDRLRGDSSAVSATLQDGLAAAEDLELRLESWLEMERDAGWTLASCDDEQHCYLAAACDRVRRRIDNWERNLGRSYRQGPGQALVYGLLEAEVDSVRRLGGSLAGFRDGWEAEEAVFAEGLDNRERLRRWDAALAGYPRSELESVLCAAAPPPPPPPYERFARDEVDPEETPVYAFEDLARLVDPAHEIGRGDYPTVFAAGLALFIDLFVLLVAVGAGLLPSLAEEGLTYPALRLVPREWGEALRRDITEWIDGALLAPDPAPASRREFLTRLIDTLRFEHGGRAVLVPRDAEQSRFGHLMARARAARPSLAGPEPPEASWEPTFVLEEWVYPALARYLAPEPDAAPA